MVHRERTNYEPVKNENYHWLWIFIVFGLWYLINTINIEPRTEPRIEQVISVTVPTSEVCSFELRKLSAAKSNNQGGRKITRIRNANKAYEDCLIEHGITYQPGTPEYDKRCKWLVETGRVNPNGSVCPIQEF
jgi:hypothetical protein